MEPQVVTQLLALMEEQVKVMSDLAVLSQKKSQVLVDGKMEDLDVLLRGEQALLWQMGRIEERRFQAQMALAAQLGIHPSQLTLERLLQIVPPNEAERCQEIAERYGATAGELAQVNQLNTELIQQAMAYVDFSLQLLGGRNPTMAQVYSPRGPRTGPDGKHRRLDNRI